MIQKSMIQSTAASSSFQRPLPATLLTATLLAALALILAPAAGAQSQLPGFSKEFSPATIGPGSVSTLRFTITNESSLPVRNLAFTDNLPAGMTVASPARAASTCSGGTLTAPEGGGTIDYSGGGVGATSMCTITVDVTAGAVGSYTNVSGDLTSDAGNSGSATADLVVAADRPGFLESFSPASVAFGGRSTVTFTIDNSANTAGAVNLTFTDNLPTGMTVASPVVVSTDCGGGTVTATGGGTTISYGPAFFTDASVAAGATCTVSVDVIANATGSLGNTTGELFSIPQTGGATRSSGMAAATLEVSLPQLALVKSFTDDPVPPGGAVTLQFTLTNLNRRSGATNVTFTDDLDAVLSGLTAVGLPLADPCGSGSQLTGTSLLTLTGGNLPAEGSCTFSVTLQVPSSAPSGSYTNVTSEVTGDVGGRPVTDFPATDVLFVEPVPELTKSFVDDPVGGGGTVTLELTITNTSPDFEAMDVSFNDVLDVILESASSLPSGGFCGRDATIAFIPANSFNPPQLVVTNASLAAGSSCTFSVVLDVAVGAAGGIYPNTTSEVTATVAGETVTGDPASDDLEVVAAPTLQKELTDDPVAPGDTVTLQFTLIHGENAAGDATDVTFTDDLDAALSGLVATGLPASDVCGVGSQLSGSMTLLLTGGTLSPGETCTFSVTLQVPSDAAAGNHTNTTSAVVASVLGVETTSPSASAELSIAGLTLTKELTDDPVLPGGTVNLRFTVENVSPTATATDIRFSDNLDDALSGLTATGLPLGDPCGAGSSLTGSSGDRLLAFEGGSLGPGTSCTFDVTLQVPSDAVPGVYPNRTTGFQATIDGVPNVTFENATDGLEVSSTDLLGLTKEFVDDPVGPGETVTLRFTVTNLDASSPVTAIAFTDDLDAALDGLVSSSGTLADVCGAGSQLAGASLLTFTGGTLAAGGSCTFDVLLTVPADVPLGTVAINVTSDVTGDLGGVTVSGPAATDDLRIDFLEFGKSFGGVVNPGDVVTLTFTIDNLSATDGITELSFTDDLNAVLPGLEAIGLPAFDVCGEGSELDGTTFLTFSGGNLLPAGSCTFGVDLQVPEDAEGGSYLNVTSELTRLGLSLAKAATATLVVEEVVDGDGDGVLDGVDVCPGTEIPEAVPTVTLRPNRYALVDDDLIFDTVTPPGGGPGEELTTADTAGCSCEQIIDALGLGNGHRKFGCSLGAMREWTSLVATRAFQASR